MRTFWLNFHVNYACRHSGACCSSGWPIPVEHDCVTPIRSLAARLDNAWLVPAVDAPAAVAGILALSANGHCVFHGDTGCGVYAARPASCAHFPYVCLIDPRGVHVTLSHYCPTAVSMLFEPAQPIAIVEGPSPVPDRAFPEGLDARESLPPLASPGRLMTFEALTAWEQSAVAASYSAGPVAIDASVRRELFERARQAVPAPLDWPAAPGDLDRLWSELVAPAWADYAVALARYRAAKAFASWALYLGDGIAAVNRSVEQAVAVLQVEAARQCAADGQVLNAGRLTEAIRRTDLLLVHYADAALLL